MYKVSFVPEAASRLLLPRRHRENLRPQLHRLRKSLEPVKQLKTQQKKRPPDLPVAFPSLLLKIILYAKLVLHPFSVYC